MEIKEILDEIKKLKSMADLSPEKYAEEGGLAESFVRELKKDRRKEMKATQLRKVFHQVKDLKREFKRPEDFSRGKIALIMPTIAYAVGRELIPPNFYELMKLCFGQDRCKTKADFDNAADFLEAIMAYHKYVNG
jgi:CRISPR-associated protein Csm2